MSFREWKFIKLGEIGTIITGKTPSTKNEDNFGNKYPFITPRDMDGQKRIVDFTERYLSQQGLESVSKQVLDGISICVSCIGSDMGKVILARTKCVTNQQINSITSIKEDYDPFFIYYSLKPLKEYFHKIAGGSTMPIINKSKFSQIEILVPPLKEQKAIAHILSTLDEKIEINKKINKTLEDIAQAIFKHWFVDFEFPNEDGEPYKSSGGEMVESELGMIPKGWKVLEMGSIINVKDGTHDSPKPVVDGYPLITSKHLMVNKIDFKSANKISETDYNEVNKRSKVHRYDILISMIGTVGNLYLVQNEEIKFAIKNIGLFKTSERLDLYEYIYCYLNTPQIKHYITGRMAGSTQEYISLGELRKIPVLIPKGRLVNYFKKIVNPIFNKIYILSTEIEKLTDIRDTLLPKLMSGEIRVPLDQEGDCEEVS